MNPQPDQTKKQFKIVTETKYITNYTVRADTLEEAKEIILDGRQSWLRGVAFVMSMPEFATETILESEEAE